MMEVYISEEELKKTVFECLKKLGEKKKEEIDYIIAIGTGGFVIAKYIYEIFKSEELKKELGVENKEVELIPIVISRYKEKRGEEVKEKEWFSTNIEGKVVLVVDDVSDEGETFIYVKKKLERLNPKQIITLSLHLKEGSRFIPDVYGEVRKREEWIVYPYEKEALERFYFE